MNPVLKNGDTILVSGILYLFKTPKINDIVAFKRKEGEVLIKRIKEIKNGKFYLSGDNKFDSFDSKNFGFIAKENIIGKLIHKL